MNEWMDELIHDWINIRMDEWMYQWINKWMDAGMDEWIIKMNEWLTDPNESKGSSGRTDERMYEWMDWRQPSGQTNGLLNICNNRGTDE